MKKTVIIGRYNANRYEVVQVYPDGGEDVVYVAGNSPADSQVFVGENLSVGLDTMKEWCTQTAQDISEECGWEFAGVEPLEEDDDDLEAEIDPSIYNAKIAETAKRIINTGCNRNMSMEDIVAIAMLLVAESNMSGTAQHEMYNIRKFV